jgi:tetratricopeptide (TPR) repeat protein
VTAGIIVSMASVSPARARQPPSRTLLQGARFEKGITQAQAIATFTQLAKDHGVAVPAASLKRMFSRWENNPVVPDPQYRMLLRELYGRTDAELGFPADDTGAGHEDALTEIRARLARSQGVDGALLARLDAQTHQLRLLDRRLGAASVLDQITSHISLVRQLMTHTVLSRDRRALARIIADASALAGWQALDTAAIMRAWQHFDLARSAGQEAGAGSVYAHALGEQSYALADIGKYPDALALLEEAASVPLLPPLMRCWLAAAHADMRAYLGDRDAARRGFDQAEHLLPADCDDPTLPYLSLNTAHLTRWRGHGLALLGEPEAIDYLTAALDEHNPEFVRAECGLRTDLAHALHAVGERAEAREHALIAKQLAVQIGSERNRRRVTPLTPPL